MESSNEEDRSFSPKSQPEPAIDKTFVEESGPIPALSPLATGARLDITSLGHSNPYSQQGTREITAPDMLPTGNEKIPLGSGTVHGVLGTGGMARVYKIWNDKLEVFRAVKILLPTRQADLRSRFETESKITAKLHHPNIVEIYNVGDWNGLPYLEMEYIEGDSLEAIISRRGKLPAVVCCATAIFVARALAYAHEQEFLIYGKNYHGVIHRDMKPANVMISASGTVKLMDFGIARPTETSLHTVEGNIVGTMQYLSPEQIDGIDIDCRTDIYSFGAILYEMLTGTKTFPQETITNLIKRKVINEYRKFSDFDFAVSPVLSVITHKCLQVDKTARYASAKELSGELEAALKTMSLDDPIQILRGYFDDPDNYIAPAERKTIRLSIPYTRKLLLPLVAALLFLGVVGGFVGTMMAKKSKTWESTVVQTSQRSAPEPVSPSVPPTAANPSVKQTDEADLKPLAAAEESSSQSPIKRANPASSGVSAKAPPSATEQQGTAPSVLPHSTPKSGQSIDRLAAKYGTKDLLSIGRSALGAGKPAEALLALEALPDSNTDLKAKNLLLLETYIEAGRAKDALFIATSQSIPDAQFDVLCGRLYRILGKSQTALDCLENALTKPSVTRNRREIRNDALYYTALVRTDLYRKDSSADNREQALNGWNVVKKMYADAQDHARFKQAEDELSLLK